MRWSRTDTGRIVWREELPVGLFGKTLLVVGFARIGTRIAKACLALGMTVRVTILTSPRRSSRRPDVCPESDLDAALPAPTS
jgi:D-3-phosphoglycerate dehydrogenase